MISDDFTSDALYSFEPRVQPLSIDAFQKGIDAEQQKEDAKKVIVAAQNPILQDSIIHAKEAAAIKEALPAAKKANSKGWSEEDVIEEKKKIQTIEKTQAVEDDEPGYFGGLFQYLAGRALALKNYFWRSTDPVKANENVPGFQSSNTMFESHAVIHSTLDKDYKRLQQDLAKLLDKAEAIRKDMHKLADPGMNKDMDAIFLLLLRLMMTGKEKEFITAKEQLSKKYRDREKDLDKRWDELQKMRKIILDQGFWANVENASMFVTKAALIGSAAVILAPTLGVQLTVVAAAALLFADLKKEAIGKELALVSTVLVSGTEQQHAKFWEGTLGTAVVVAQVGAGGVVGANQLMSIVNLISSTSQGVAGISRAHSEYDKSRTQGRMGKIDDDLRLAGEDISGGAKKLSAALKVLETQARKSLLNAARKFMINYYFLLKILGVNYGN